MKRFRSSPRSFPLLKRIFDWIEDRTGLKAAILPIIQHVVPPNTGWYYVFGSATLVAFLIQVFTGTLLSLAYIPSSSQAYNTLQFITHDAYFGRVLRGIHFFGASAMILLMGMHIIRTFLMAAYKFPREASWMSGVFLLFLTLGMGFTGQLLRWDQNAVWSVVVGTEQAARVPFVGKYLAHFIMGGEVLGGATLSRFFSAHVFFLPGIMFGLIGLHLFLVLRNGISERPKVGEIVDQSTYRAKYEAMLKKEGEPFWPNAAWRDVAFGSCVVIIIVALAVAFGPPELGHLPDPSLIDAQPRPDWYLLWYFAVLAMLPHGSESYVIVLGPLAFGALIFMLPLYAKDGYRHPSRRPWAVVIVVAVVTIISSFTVAGYQSNWSPDFNPKPLSLDVVASTDFHVIEGSHLFYRKACLDCHRIGDEGGKRGPDLSRVAERLTREEMIIRITNGGYNMPAFGPTLKPDELSDLVSFLETRKRKGL
jgi:ubiquinol-cytochrome c reductase cytochrome b subunit